MNIDNKHKFDLTTPADDIDYDPLASSKDIEVNITKIKGRQKPIIDYKNVSRDFIKIDRSVLDVVVPFLMNKYSSGTSVLYIMLYRLSYGFRKNNLNINDEELARRTGIKKRTLFKYRDELIECDLIHYERGYKTTKKPCYTILLPEQSEAFKNILHKNTNILHKNVKSSESNNTIYKFIDNNTKDIETLVREFYTKIGKTEYHLTRKVLADGIKVIQSLLTEDYRLEDINNCIDYTLNKRKDIYSISYLNYTIGEYLVEKENEINRKKVEAEETKKEKIRLKKLSLEKHLETLFSELPNDIQNTIKLEAEELANEYITANDIKFGERFIIADYLNKLIEVKFSKVVEKW